MTGLQVVVYSGLGTLGVGIGAVLGLLILARYIRWREETAERRKQDRCYALHEKTRETPPRAGQTWCGYDEERLRVLEVVGQMGEENQMVRCAVGPGWQTRLVPMRDWQQMVDMEERFLARE